MHHSVYNGCRDDRVSQVIAEILESNVRGEKRRSLTVTAVDDLEEQGGILSILLLQPIKT